VAEIKGSVNPARPGESWLVQVQRAECAALMGKKQIRNAPSFASLRKELAPASFREALDNCHNAWQELGNAIYLEFKPLMDWLKKRVS